MNAEHALGPIIPHSDFGNADCCGCLFGVSRGDQSDIVCNECDVIVRTVPVTDLARTLREMELQAMLLAQCVPTVVRFIWLQSSLTDRIRPRRVRRNRQALRRPWD